MKPRQGFVIYAGQGTLAKSIFRVSTMGAIAHADMERFLAVVRQIILETKPDK
jgi:2-aminoethylphosphonate-pyruvate transaminase